ncbi:diguanylate cyclase [Staphylococcus schleiferi]|uniref:GGDEF domain-containing protein GdpS n=1 Tax=Staphylococcus schleiferi TaxID=1295 RepID=UPI0018874B99|nr:GGDEF domain-containing protein [Staphylococcus schleiferi]MBF1991895.1 diguanylate cyclase [Staphylococcus schleiferi]MBF2039347.1 diguanylate cyclase [Staphylococcus schleiferi]MBF2101352.1 diguanylate cyclase [Staphylococcus schleiferi]MBF2101736.1 diguanylate cyclase [Staphylococcus schleiferi]MBF2103753.1 diguanylate cyclase [Staphylococcus schleiferi]
MIEAIIYNISVTIAGIYLFHRLQYVESHDFRFSKSYITVLMTIVGLLLALYPVPIEHYMVQLSFVPLLFLGRYTNSFYTFISAMIIALVGYFVLSTSLTYAIALIIIAGVVSTIGPFLKQNHVVAIQILNVLSIIILTVIALFMPSYDIKEVIYLIPLSVIATLVTAIFYVDLLRFFSLIERYENEETVDYLTGLGNVKEFDRHLNEVSRIADDNNQSLALLLIDIDGFKDVNDAHTHRAGDAVLKQMSHLFQNYVPKKTKIFRNGGEEFSIVLRHYSLDECVKLAENIRKAVEKSNFHLPDKTVIKLSVSIGVGYLDSDAHKSHRKVFKDADDMLHVAKNEGRNKVMFNPIIKLQ